MNDEEIKKVSRAMMLEEIKSEIIDWAKARFWFIGIVVVLLGFFGLDSLVERAVSGHTNEILKLRVKFEENLERSKNLLTQSEELQNNLNVEMRSYEQFRTNLSKLDTELAGARSKIEEATEASEIISLQLLNIQDEKESAQKAHIREFWNSDINSKYTVTVAASNRLSNSEELSGTASWSLHLIGFRQGIMFGLHPRLIDKDLNFLGLGVFVENSKSISILYHHSANIPAQTIKRRLEQKKSFSETHIRLYPIPDDLFSSQKTIKRKEDIYLVIGVGRQ